MQAQIQGNETAGKRSRPALLAQAIEAEVADFLGKHADLKNEQGHQRLVRHGHLPEREVMTGIGPVAVRQPRVREREATASDPVRIRFSPTILPPYMRRSKSIETLLPILYLKGVSTGDFSEALAALLGKDAAGLSASAIGRLQDGWQDDHAAWSKRDLSAKRYVYVWADGIHLQARLEDEKQCILVVIGATPEGRKELVGFTDGARESAHDWRALLLDLKRRGLDASPELMIADGALVALKARLRHDASGRPPAKSGRKRASNAAGCTRPRLTILFDMRPWNYTTGLTARQKPCFPCASQVGSANRWECR